MAAIVADISPVQAWQPLPANEWTRDHARHLLRRIGFSAPPTWVDQSYNLGLKGTLDNAFGKVRLMPTPAGVASYGQFSDDMQVQMQFQRQAQSQSSTRRGVGRGAPEMTQQERQMLVREINQTQRQNFLDYARDWLAFARQPENSAQENLVMFLGNVFTVSQTKMKNPEWAFQHSHILRSYWQKPYADIVKSVTFSPAMIDYLDLYANIRGVPNENYARELMELFTLGEGNYTENDIKEAARALTGIKIFNDKGQFVMRDWDAGTKTIFRRSGNYGAMELVDLIFKQPAARQHLPRRFLAYYLSPDPLPQAYLDELATRWTQRAWRVDELARLVFSSRIFYQPAMRRAMIKSPIQFYLGLCQDLNLDVPPFAGQVSQLLRTMGQEPFNAPNVRGWLGGRTWINSSTLAARRQLVQQLFAPVNVNTLDADQQAMLADAQRDGAGRLTVSNEQLQVLAAKPDEQIADDMLGYFLAGEKHDEYRRFILDYLQNNRGQRIELVREVSIALFQSPEYHLC